MNNQDLSPRLKLPSEDSIALIKAFNKVESFDTATILKIFQKIKQDSQTPHISIEYGCWLTSHILYLQTALIQEQDQLLAKTKLLLVSQNLCVTAQAEFFAIAQNNMVVIAVFNTDVSQFSQSNFSQNYHLIALCHNNPIIINGQIDTVSNNVNFFAYVNHQPQINKHLIREEISKKIIKFVSPKNQEELKFLWQKLQNFIQVSNKSLMDVQLPLNACLDYVIPIGWDGIVLVGWLSDFYEQLESIEVISALGFSVSTHATNLYRFHRQDANEYMKQNNYVFIDDKNHGFCTYINIPKPIKQQWQNLAEMQSFRVKLHLKDGSSIPLVTDKKIQDIFTARKLILNAINPQNADDDLIRKCILPAALKLQQLCIKTIDVNKVIKLGEINNNPLVSLIIPLYKQLEFIKTQLAMMSLDDDLKKAEIIYVLDSPEQASEVENILREYQQLYEIPLTLIIMNKNGGYASANNMGAKYAKGTYLLLMNSDVIPKQRKWLNSLIDAYQTSDKIGALAPKLIYEDQSLQHAGMYFKKTTFPFWLTFHYYKGFYYQYPPAQNSRPVPAVTGACLLISKQLYDQVGGLSTDYIIGDFEDSDLCLKCQQLGYENWYYADVELYHLERQSIPLNSVYNHSLAWRCNAELHESRWGKYIPQIMQKYNY